MPVERIPWAAVVLDLVSCVLVLRWFIGPGLRGLGRRRGPIPLVAFFWIRSSGILAVFAIPFGGGSAEARRPPPPPLSPSRAAP